MTLGDFLLAQSGDRSSWNCSTMAADWCIALGHPDFAAKWRDVTDVAECESIASGNLLSLWDEGIGASLPAVTDFMVGDIAVVGRAGLQAGAIYTGQRWALRREGGISSLPLAPAAIVKAWRP
jgi:hypothetical protein